MSSVTLTSDDIVDQYLEDTRREENKGKNNGTEPRVHHACEDSQSWKQNGNKAMISNPSAYHMNTRTHSSFDYRDIKSSYLILLMPSQISSVATRGPGSKQTHMIWKRSPTGWISCRGSECLKNR